MRPARLRQSRAPQRPRAAPALLRPGMPHRPHRYQHPDTRAPLHVEVDHGSTSSRRRPAGHVWLVRLRRGNHQAIIAIGLGRPSAEHLASQIREVINPPPGAPPPRIR